MASAVLQGGEFAEYQELGFQTAKRSYMGCAELKGCRLATSQESHFQAARRSDMSSAILQEVDMLILRNRVFRV